MPCALEVDSEPGNAQLLDWERKWALLRAKTGKKVRRGTGNSMARDFLLNSSPSMLVVCSAPGQDYVP